MYAVTAAVYVAFFAAAAHFAKQNAPKSGFETMRGLQQTVREPAQPRRVIYGRAKVGGILAYVASTGPKNAVLHLAVTLAGHECDAIEDIYVNDRKADSSRFIKAPRISNTVIGFQADSGGKTGYIISNYWLPPLHPETPPQEAVTVDLNKAFPQANKVLVVEGPGPNAGLYRIRQTGKSSDRSSRRLAVERLDGGTMQDQPVDPDNGSKYTVHERYLQFVTRRGTADQSAIPEMVENLDDWTSQHRLRGVAYCYLALYYHHSIWATGVPNITAVVRGKRVYDPRTGQTAWTDNAALCIADYLTDPLYGVGAAWSEIDEAALIAAANICDETISVNGKNVRRYTLNGAFDCSEPPAQMLPKLCSAMAGTVVYSGGKWVIRAGAFEVPTVTLDESHLRDSIKIQPRLGRQDIFNGVRGVFADADNDYQPTDFPPIQSATAIAEDNGEEIWTNVELPFTNSSQEAQRLARIALNKARQQIVVHYPCNLAGLLVRAGDTVYLNNTRMGWESKPFEVVDWEFATYEDDQGAPLLGVDLTLRETAPEVYALGEVYAQDPSPDTNLPSPWELDAPTGLRLASGSEHLQRQSDGTIISRIYAEWTPPANAVDPRYEVEYADEDTGQIVTVVTESPNTYLAPVRDGTTYTVSVTAINGLGARSDRVTATHTVIGKTAPPADVPWFYIEGRVLTWGPVNEADLAGYVIRYQYGDSASFASGIPLHDGILTACTYEMPFTPSGQVTLMIRAVDTSGNYSQSSARIRTGFGDPVPLNILTTRDLHAQGFPGVVTGGSVEPGTGDLVADPQTPLMWGAPAANMWRENPDSLMWATVQYAALSYVTEWVPTPVEAGHRMLLTADVAGQDHRILYRRVGPSRFYSEDDSMPFYGPDAEPFYEPVPDWRIWPGEVTARNEPFQLMITTGQSTEQGRIAELRIDVDVPDIIDILNDVLIEPGGTRLPIHSQFHVITHVSITLQHDGGSAAYAKVMDKDRELGPLVQCYDISGNPTAGLIDAEVRGY